MYKEHNSIFHLSALVCLFCNIIIINFNSVINNTNSIFQFSSCIIYYTKKFYSKNDNVVTEY